MGHFPSACFWNPNKNIKACKWCKSVKHASWQCRERPTKKPRPTIRQQGKHAILWMETRRLWFSLNPPDDGGYYYCYLCGKAMLGQIETTLDHRKSRSRRPDLRYVLSNLAPCCYKCNNLKGSKNDDEMVQFNTENDEKQQ